MNFLQRWLGRKTKAVIQSEPKEPEYIPVEPSEFQQIVKGIRMVAKVNGYTEIDLQQNNRMISFKRDDIRINVYYSTMTVGTCLNHPKQGKTQLFRRNVTGALLDQLFKNPRTHTSLGYKKKV